MAFIAHISREWRALERKITEWQENEKLTILIQYHLKIAYKALDATANALNNVRATSNLFISFEIKHNNISHPFSMPNTCQTIFEVNESWNARYYIQMIHDPAF